MSAEAIQESRATKSIRILVVDDEPSALKAMSHTLRNIECDLKTASSAEEARSRVQEGFEPAIVISDFRMPGEDGLDFLAWVKQEFPSSRRIMVSGYADRGRVEHALAEDVVHSFLTKPWDIDLFSNTVRAAIQTYSRESTIDDVEFLVQERTRQLEAAKKAWEEVFDVFSSPLAVVRKDFTIERANLAYAEAADSKIQNVPGGLCYETLFGRDAPCVECPLLKDGDDKIATEVSDERTDRVYEVNRYLFGATSLSGDSQRYVALYNDVTAKRQLERQLFQTEKMAALGVLSGEIAHEINNPVGIILSFSQLALRSELVDDDEDLKEFLGEILGSARRCKSIIRNLLSFSRPSMVGSTETLDMPDLVQRTLEIAGGSLRIADITVSTNFGENCPEVRGWPDQIQQVVLNLVTNAVHALESKSGGAKVAISTRSSRFLGSPALLLTVADNGTGIPPEKISRVFEPFFSTKAAGKGTGLGLSICYRIIEEHGGTIEVTNQTGSGAMFRIYLPEYRPPEK